MIRHFAGVAEIVGDFDAAVRFYRDALGLEVEDVSEGYATVDMPGVLHFGIWARATAAEAAFGSADAAGRVPLGYTIGLEVDSVGESATGLGAAGVELLHSAKTEPWGQVTARFLAPGGGLCEVAETPWAREIAGDVAAEVGDAAMVKRFAGVGEMVDDFEAAERFYGDVLGLKVTGVSEGFATVELAGVPHLGIWSRVAAAEATFGSADAVDRIPLGYSIALFVDSAGEFARRVDAVGAESLFSNEGMVTLLSPGSGGLCEVAGTPEGSVGDCAAVE